jgi:DHA2 family multidrug resistance protein-like MFS transporter
VIAGYALVRRQTSLAVPLLPIDLFKFPVFALSVTASVCAFVANGIVFVALPFYFQDVIDRSQVETGLLMTPWPVTVAIIAPLAGRLADRYPAGILGGIGLGVMSLGFILLALLPEQPSDADIIWRMTVCGFGFGFFQSPNNRAIITSAPRERSGGAGAIQGTSRLLGQTIGAALVALIFGYSGPAGGTSPTAAILLAAAFSVLAAIASVCRLLNIVRLHRPPRAPDSVGPSESREEATMRSPP